MLGTSSFSANVGFLCACVRTCVNVSSYVVHHDGYNVRCFNGAVGCTNEFATEGKRVEMDKKLSLFSVNNCIIIIGKTSKLRFKRNNCPLLLTLCCRKSLFRKSYSVPIFVIFSIIMFSHCQVK